MEGRLLDGVDETRGDGRAECSLAGGWGDERCCSLLGLGPCPGLGDGTGSLLSLFLGVDGDGLSSGAGEGLSPIRETRLAFDRLSPGDLSSTGVMARGSLE